jgi:hypothetical protein
MAVRGFVKNFEKSHEEPELFLSPRGQPKTPRGPPAPRVMNSNAIQAQVKLIETGQLTARGAASPRPTPVVKPESSASSSSRDSSCVSFLLHCEFNF